MKTEVYSVIDTQKNPGPDGFTAEFKQFNRNNSHSSKTFQNN